MTFPFALIPVIPNFPFFYILWRAWSHYKAWRGASYLESLLKLGMIVSIFIWIRASVPRLRYDQLMRFGWKVLLPVATVNALVTAFFVVLVP